MIIFPNTIYMVLSCLIAKHASVESIATGQLTGINRTDVRIGCRGWKLFLQIWNYTLKPVIYNLLRVFVEGKGSTIFIIRYKKKPGKSIVQVLMYTEMESQTYQLLRKPLGGFFWAEYWKWRTQRSESGQSLLGAAKSVCNRKTFNGPFTDYITPIQRIETLSCNCTVYV